MKKRYLTEVVERIALKRGKMAFVSGPRQVGKTTLSKLIRGSAGGYYGNWDDIDFRRAWTKSPRQIAENISYGEYLILDEIHKAKGWKGALKGLFDTLTKRVSIIVTGSARLGVYFKGGDSLMGRYINFRLHPFSVAECNGIYGTEPKQFLTALNQLPKTKKKSNSTVEKLFQRGGFPEPYLETSEKNRNIWRRSRAEKIVREDLRDLSRLPELSQVEMLMSLLPEKVGSTMSIESLREDLEVAHDTVSRWMKYLESLYYFYTLRPYSKNLKRSLKKDGKIYLWDWSEIKDSGPRFENMVASHLLKAVHYWTDTGEGLFDLHYLRTKDKEEVDFLITQDQKPWIAIEAKYSDENWEPNLFAFAKRIDCPIFIQVVFKSGVFKQKTYEGKTLLMISANSLLGILT
jgi:predicted AAA+ superfamily ATPase